MATRRQLERARLPRAAQGRATGAPRHCPFGSCVIHSASHRGGATAQGRRGVSGHEACLLLRDGGEREHVVPEGNELARRPQLSPSVPALSPGSKLCRREVVLVGGVCLKPQSGGPVVRQNAQGRGGGRVGADDRLRCGSGAVRGEGAGEAMGHADEVRKEQDGVVATCARPLPCHVR